jgi:hypothetical protein
MEGELPPDDDMEPVLTAPPPPLAPSPSVPAAEQPASMSGEMLKVKASSPRGKNERITPSSSTPTGLRVGRFGRSHKKCLALTLG